MTESQNEKCQGHLMCTRKPFSGDLCEFHLPIGHVDALTPDKYDALLIKEIEGAVENNNETYALHWHGFIFPKDHVLFGSVNFHTVRERLAKSWINIQESNIQNIEIPSYDIDTLILSNAIIRGYTMIGTSVINSLRMPHASFRGRFHCASKSNEFIARSAIFEDEFSFASSINVLADFRSCRFYKSCSFNGGGTRFVFGDKGNNRFKAAGFDNAIFGSSSQTLFQDINLQKATFSSVSLIGVRFYNTNFYQAELGRNGLYNEVKELQRSGKTICRWLCNKKKPDDSSKRRFRHLVHECRQLRMAMESNKDYVKSHDFYIGEMEARQRRQCSRILKLYDLSSHYGTNYVKAFGFLLLLFIIHFSSTIFFSTHWQLQKLFDGPDIVAAWGRLGDIVIHTLSTGTLQKTGLLENISGCQKFIDIFFRLIIPIQAAMFVLALRNKTKR